MNASTVFTPNTFVSRKLHWKPVPFKSFPRQCCTAFAKWNFTIIGTIFLNSLYFCKMISATIQKSPSSKNNGSKSCFKWFKTLYKLCYAVYTATDSVTVFDRYGINVVCMIDR